MNREPRPHQLRAVTMLRDAYRRGKRRPLLQIATGGGKTFVAAMIIESARKRGHRVLFIVDAISLIDQTISALYEEGLYGLGVIQSDHPMTNWGASIIVGSLQTLRRRGMPKGIQLVIVDEAHGQDAWLKEIMASEEWADVPFIGLSATPWSKGLGHVYDDLLIPITMQELIEQGHLCPFNFFAAAHPDLAKVKTVGGDYHEGQLSEVMSQPQLVADVVTTWQRLGENRPTLCFAVDRAHAKKVQQRFLDAGIAAAYIDAYTERTERNKIREQLDAGAVRVVVNVGCLTKGVDWRIGCIILDRPTKSEMLFVQMVGRGMRVNDGLLDCIILDHGDNALRLGFPTDIKHDALCTATKGERKARVQPERLPKECTSCSYLKPAGVHACPSCGFAPEKRSDIEEAEGELVPLTRARMKASLADRQSWLSQLNTIAATKRYSSGWAAQTYKKRFGAWPSNRMDRYATEEPSAEVRNFVTHCMISFAKRKAA